MRLSETCRSNHLGIDYQICLAAIALACILLSGCAKEQAREQAPMIPLVEASPTPAQAAATASPQANEAQEVLHRVFKDAAVLDAAHSPNYVSGDFNGDSSMDIALVVKPASGK